eukprot:ANDGO_02348.mRNA.1 hypothetical protein
MLRRPPTKLEVGTEADFEDVCAVRDFNCRYPHSANDGKPRRVFGSQEPQNTIASLAQQARAHSSTSSTTTSQS